MITNAYETNYFLDGGTREIEYVEDGVHKQCFIDFSIGTKNRGKIFEKMSMTSGKFSNELDEQKSLMIKLLVEMNEGK